MVRVMAEAGIYIHAGAHRTGTSSFQLFLSANAARIRAMGHDLAYPARDGIPGGRLRLRLPGLGTGGRRRDELRAFLTEEMAVHSTAPDRPLILSEENIPGRMMHFYGGAFYPAIRRRLRLLRSVLPGPVRRLVYVIRPYDALFVSAFRKRSEDNPVDPFDTIKPALLGMEEGWPHVVSALRDVLAPEELVVRSYDRRGDDADLLRRLVPDLPEGGWQMPERRLNVSATDAALFALQGVYAAGGTLDRAGWQAVVSDHSGDRADRGYARFTKEERALLRARYDDHLAELGSMDGIVLET
ncbi:hypothetical protein OB2597_04198 [Pseudooceanicola batsensis HTCC2597]|uniref:Sulfotransferase family protein n=2 Tax=Pseudooceanicola batsensis TaxID=314255 RepID=A3U2N6_PSEBH|nr:hypothetical protein OB2597_04198 [Pseudooceanicola batsensis HTCC2597]